MPRLDMPTLYASLAACCLVLSLVWFMAGRSFPTFGAAKYWSAGMLAVAFGAVMSIFRGQVPPLVSVLLVNGLFLLGAGLILAGVRTYRDKSVPWLVIAANICTAVVLLGVFAVWTNDIAMRVAVYSTAQCVFVAWVMVELLSDPQDRWTPGVAMAVLACATMMALNVLRTTLALAAVGGEFGFTTFNPVQSLILFLLAACGILVCQFGCLLMTMDRLRRDMAALAVTDELTGVANRRRFQEWAATACAHADRTGDAFSLMMIDIDRFKWINDTHGHGVGDEFLRLVARTMREHMRGQDLFARVGGDEFCVLMPDTVAQQAGAVGERLAALFSSQSLPHKGEPITSTISIGIVQWTPAVGSNFPALMASADRALYQSKAGGRNGVTVVTGLPAKPPPEQPLRRTADQHWAA